MKRIWGLVMLLTLLLPPVALGETAFFWDVRDAGITTVSSGTGGTPGDFTPVARAFVHPEDLEAEDLLHLWEAEDVLSAWERDVVDSGEMGVAETTPQVVDGRLYQCVLWETELHTWEYAEPVHWRMRAMAVDLETGQAVGLSDLFYDGFNYIAYINDQAASALLRDDYSGEDLTPVTEEMLRRSFSGFPRDYPYFRIAKGDLGGRVLELLVNAENPLFDTGMPYYYPSLRIPLPDTVSPYGVLWADITVDRSDPEMHVARVTLPEGKDPAVEERINAALRALPEQALAHPILAAGGSWDTPMVPRVNINGRFLTASYYASEAWREGDQPTMAAVCLSLETGEPVDGGAVWQAARRVWDAYEEGELTEEPETQFRQDDWGDGDWGEIDPAELVYVGCRGGWTWQREEWLYVTYYHPPSETEQEVWALVSELEAVGWDEAEVYRGGASAVTEDEPFL